VVRPHTRITHHPLHPKSSPPDPPPKSSVLSVPSVPLGPSVVFPSHSRRRTGSPSCFQAENHGFCAWALA
jgi:hypothetical protein